MKTFYQSDSALHFLASIALFLIGAFMLQIQAIAGTIFISAGLFYLFCSFLVNVKTGIHADRLIAYKVLGRREIAFDKIKNLSVENRHFVGEGRFSARKAVVIAYIGEFGYGDELVLACHDGLHACLKEKPGHE